MYSIRQYDESLLSLNRSVDLYRSDAGDPETLAVTLAMLARARMALNDMAGARANLEEAIQSAKQFRADYPLYAAFIETSYGDYLASNRQWPEARAQYLDSISLMKPESETKDELSECLLKAAGADDHLHRKKESKMLRKQAQALITESRTPGQGSTVDLTTLQVSGSRALKPAWPSPACDNMGRNGLRT